MAYYECSGNGEIEQTKITLSGNPVTYTFPDDCTYVFISCYYNLSNGGTESIYYNNTLINTFSGGSGHPYIIINGYAKKGDTISANTKLGWGSAIPTIITSKVK